MDKPVKILGDITDAMINNFGMLSGGAKPGDSAYDKSLARLVSAGGEELKGVSDPLEKIFSSVSNYIEEHGMTSRMRTEHARMSEAIAGGRKLSNFNRLSHQARDFGEVLRETRLAPPAAPSVSTPVKSPPPAAPSVSAPVKSSSTDMLELARKLIPDIETGMPEDVAKAFAEGKIKTIFRTSDSPGLASFGRTGDSGYTGGRIDAGSTYFLNEDGGIARYGRHGAGWGDARLTSEGTGVVRSSFLDEAIFTKESFNVPRATAKSIDEGIASGVHSTKPGIGLGLVEFDRDAAGELIPGKTHSGHWVSDIYHSSGEAEFTPHLNTKKGAPRNSNLDVVKANISDINFESQTDSFNTIGVPRLKTPSSGLHPTAPPTSVAEDIAPTSTTAEAVAKLSSDEPVIKTPDNRVRGSGLNIGTPADDIRIRPTRKGADAASRLVVDSGGTRPVINVEPPKPDTIKPPVDKPADVSAKITTDPTTPVKDAPDASSRIKKITSTGKTVKDNGMDVAKNISSGNARTMGIAAIAGLLGAGAYGLNKKKEENIQSKVNRQRHGEI